MKKRLTGCGAPFDQESENFTIPNIHQFRREREERKRERDRVCTSERVQDRGRQRDRKRRRGLELLARSIKRGKREVGKKGEEEGELKCW